MPLYDVDLTVTMRVVAKDQTDAETDAFLAVEEALYGSAIMAVEGPNDDSIARVKARAEETGLTLAHERTERVVTPRPYDVGPAPRAP